jgi:hypothetical protein
MKGFAAIISVIIIGAVLIVAGTMATMTSINEGQMSLSRLQSNNSLGFIESCAEESLITINENNTLPSLIITPNGNCTVSVNSQVGTSWDFTLNGTVNGYQKSHNLKLNRGSSLGIGSWQEQ